MFAQLFIIFVTFSTSYASLSEPFAEDKKHGNFSFQYSANYNYVVGSIWPTPQHESRQSTYFTLDPKNFVFQSTGQQSDVLIEALVRYKYLTFPIDSLKPDASHTKILKLEVNVLFPYKPMELLTDESCLESFSQVVHEGASGNHYYAQENKVIDYPRFHHRGFLIDTSRHFVNKKFIKQFIDCLAYSKFNILHWHIVDDQSFPYVSKHFPKLSGEGARDSVRSIYTPEDIKGIIDYGRFRGIRILPEFDTPGHTQSWAGIPNLLTPCYSGGKPNGRLGPINPTLESTYTFLKEFFEEVSKLFPDPYLHLGGDEVSFACWASNPQILDWMAKHGMGKNFSLLEQYYEQRLLDIVSVLGKKYVIWQEVLDNQVKVKPDTVVNVWKGGWKDEMNRVSKLGYRTILSSCWYLNYISYDGDWEKYYKCDPHDFTGTQAQKDSVIGGTACMWGEWVDGVNLISRSWGRGMSVGGRLWSSKETTNIYDAYRRMWEHRCRYLMRGIGADTITAYQYCRHEWQNE